MQNRLIPTLVTTLILPLLLLSGCASTTGNNPTANVNKGLNIGKTVFQTAVNNKCRSELTNHQLWSIAKLVYNDSKQQEIQSSVCGCVSTKAVENVTTGELANAVIDQNYRNQMVVTAVTNSLNACYGTIAKTLTTN